ncbi:MAG: hypothetical protein FE041_06295 [Thermoplasmata archaeon]|nr:MAG: hypothetical protein FE041_06295 [Thermoplasmata archaeon]
MYTNLLVKRFGNKITPKFIYENLDKIEKEIRTEKEIDKEKIIIDVVYGRDAWEIETLFSQGLKGGITTKKIDETIEKYYEKDEKGVIKGAKLGINTINIVLDNLTLYLHFPEIRRKIIIWQKKTGKTRKKIE